MAAIYTGYNSGVRKDRRFNSVEISQDLVVRNFEVESSHVVSLSTDVSGAGAMTLSTPNGTLDVSTLGGLRVDGPVALHLDISGGLMGSKTLVGGTLTFTVNTVLAANDLIFLTRSAIGGTTGDLTYTFTPGTSSLTIDSSSGTDTSVVNYMIMKAF